jgi:hypothetical protein
MQMDKRDTPVGLTYQRGSIPKGPMQAPQVNASLATARSGQVLGRVFVSRLQHTCAFSVSRRTFAAAKARYG